MEKDIFARLCDYVLKSWDTRRGFAAGMLIIGILSYYLPLGSCRPIVGASAVGVWLVFWLLKRGGIILTRKRVVAFCLQCESGTERHLSKTIRDLRILVRSLNLDGSIVVRTIAADLVTDKDSAMKYVQKNSVDLLVSGNFDLETVDGQEISLITDGRWCGRVSGSQAEMIAAIASDVGLLVKGKQWRVRANETLYDVKMLVRRFSEIALYVIAAQLLLERNCEDAARVAKALLPILGERGSATTDPPRALFAKRVRALLFDAQVQCGHNASEHGNHNLAIEYFNDVRKLGFDNHHPTIMLAWTYYKMGDEDRARELTTEMIRSWPNDGVTLLNEAFFAIKDGSYDYAIEVYRRLLTLSQPDVTLGETLEVYAGECEKHPEELGYLFGSGLINLWFCDEELGRQDLCQFVDKSLDKPVYKRMRQFALNTLNGRKKEPKAIGRKNRRSRR